MAKQRGQSDKRQSGNGERSDDMMAMMFALCVRRKFAVELLAHRVPAGMPFGAHMMAPAPPGFALFFARSVAVGAVFAARRTVRRTFALCLFV
jgi:hypothetical protein